MKKGITLIEIIVSIAILGILVSVLMLVVNSSVRIYEKRTETLDNLSTVRAVQMEIEDSINEASYATCSFENLNFGNTYASPEYKRLLYIEPLKPGSSNYLLVLKYMESGGAELRRVYMEGSWSSRVYGSTWRQQGSTLMPKLSFSFASLNTEENESLNSQLHTYMLSSVTYGLTELSSAPAIAPSPDNVHSYFENTTTNEYLAYVNTGDRKSIVYLENIKYDKYTSMSSTNDNVVLDGIEEIDVIQDGKESFSISITCGKRVYKSNAVMRSYSRGDKLEKK